MPKTENQKLKLFRLLEILMAKTDETHGISMPQIISLLEERGIAAERKSVYSDLDCLEEMGFEVLKLTDSKPPKYALVGRYFEKAELKMLVDAIESAKFIPKSRCREIVKKLQVFAGESGAKELSRKVYVDDRVRSKSVLYSVDAIHSAINASRMISFKYFGYGVEKKKIYHRDGKIYKASPLTLVWNDANYYLIAYDEDDGRVKNFRVDRMESVKVLSKARSAQARSESVDPSAYASRVFGMYGGRESLVTLECRNSLAGVIIDRFGLNEFFERGEDSFRVRVRITVSPNFFAWVAGFGKDMKIIAPLDVRDEYVDHIRSLLENYE